MQTNAHASIKSCPLSYHPFAKDVHVILLHFSHPDHTYKCFALWIPLPCSPLPESGVCNWALIFLQSSNIRWLTKKKKKKKDGARTHCTDLTFPDKRKCMAVHKSSKYTTHVSAVRVVEANFTQLHWLELWGILIFKCWETWAFCVCHSLPAVFGNTAGNTSDMVDTDMVWYWWQIWLIYWWNFGGVLHNRL